MIAQSDVEIIMAKLQGLTGGAWDELATSAWTGQLRQLELAPAVEATEAICESYDGRTRLTWAVWRMAYNGARMRQQEQSKDHQQKQLGPEEISLAEHIARLKLRAAAKDTEAIAELERWRKFKATSGSDTTGWAAELASL